MTKLFKTKLVIVILSVLVLLASVSGFSVSYAKWTGSTAGSFSAAAAVGSWNTYGYAVVTGQGKEFPLTEINGKYSGSFYVDDNTNLKIYYSSAAISREVTSGANVAKLTGHKTYSTLCGKGFYKTEVDEATLSFTLLFAGSFSELTKNDAKMKEVLAANGCVGSDGKVAGVITSNGQVVAFGTPVTLQKGEQLVIYAAGEQAKKGSQILSGSYGISQGQSENVTIGDDNVITADTDGEYRVQIVKGNTVGNVGLVNIYDWIAIKKA